MEYLNAIYNTCSAPILELYRLSARAHEEFPQRHRTASVARTDVDTAAEGVPYYVSVNSSYSVIQLLLPCACSVHESISVARWQKPKVGRCAGPAILFVGLPAREASFGLDAVSGVLLTLVPCLRGPRACAERGGVVAGIFVRFFKLTPIRRCPCSGSLPKQCASCTATRCAAAYLKPDMCICMTV